MPTAPPSALTSPLALEPTRGAGPELEHIHQVRFYQGEVTAQVCAACDRVWLQPSFSHLGTNPAAAISWDDDAPERCFAATPL